VKKAGSLAIELRILLNSPIWEDLVLGYKWYVEDWLPSHGVQNELKLSPTRKGLG
jgi:hypothetical protein